MQLFEEGKKLQEALAHSQHPRIKRISFLAKREIFFLFKNRRYFVRKRLAGAFSRKMNLVCFPHHCTNYACTQCGTSLSPISNF